MTYSLPLRKVRKFNQRMVCKSHLRSIRFSFIRRTLRSSWEGMQDVISYIKNSNLKKSAEDVVEPEEEETIHGDSPEEDMASGDYKVDIEF